MWRAGVGKSVMIEKSPSSVARTCPVSRPRKLKFLLATKCHGAMQTRVSRWVANESMNASNPSPRLYQRRVRPLTVGGWCRELVTPYLCFSFCYLCFNPIGSPRIAYCHPVVSASPCLRDRYLCVGSTVRFNLIKFAPSGRVGWYAPATARWGRERSDVGRWWDYRMDVE